MTVRIKIRSELPYGSFNHDKFIHEFLTVTGGTIEDIKKVQFRSGCTVFDAELNETVADKIFQLHRELSKYSDEEIPDHLVPLAEFMEKYIISLISKNGKYDTTQRIRKELLEPIVFYVHGLNSSKDAFKEIASLVADEAAVDNEFFEYPTGFWSHSPAVYYLATSLENFILDKLNGEVRPIVLMGHSMGGVVIRKMLSAQRTGAKSVAKHSRFVSFFASPHVGAWLATLARSVPGLTKDQIAELSPRSAQLVELNGNWSVFKDNNVHLRKNIRSFYGTDDRVVDPASAAVDDSEPIPVVGADHRSILSRSVFEVQGASTLKRLLNEAELLNAEHSGLQVDN